MGGCTCQCWSLVEHGIVRTFFRPAGLFPYGRKDVEARRSAHGGGLDRLYGRRPHSRNRPRVPLPRVADCLRLSPADGGGGPRSGPPRRSSKRGRSYLGHLLRTCARCPTSAAFVSREIPFLRGGHGVDP